MSKVIDFDKPLSDEDKLWLHQWGYDYKIVENEQRFAQAKVHDAGLPINVAGVLADAGIKVPVPQPNPAIPARFAPTGVATVAEVVESAPEASEFNEAALRVDIAELTVAELKEEIKELGGEPEGNKAHLQDQLVELLRNAE
jgi:hypothetical protein